MPEATDNLIMIISVYTFWINWKLPNLLQWMPKRQYIIAANHNPFGIVEMSLSFKCDEINALNTYARLHNS